MNKKNYLILSGGTGGHVIPAVNLGNFIIENGYDCYLFVDERGNQYTNLFKGQIRVIHASHLTHNFLGKAQSIISLLNGFFQSLKYLFKIQPYSCVSFGSYATFMPLLVLVFFRFFGLLLVLL